MPFFAFTTHLLVMNILNKTEFAILIFLMWSMLPRNLTIQNLLTYNTIVKSDNWLVGCLGLNGPLRQYFSLYRAVSQREGERKEK